MVEHEAMKKSHSFFLMLNPFQRRHFFCSCLASEQEETDYSLFRPGQSSTSHGFLIGALIETPTNSDRIPVNATVTKVTDFDTVKE
jgi:hypothetical protein